MKFNCFILLITLMILPLNLNANNIKALYILTNNIYVGGANLTSTSNYCTNSVASNDGGQFISLPDSKSNYAGSYAYFTNIFQNMGNHEDIFKMYVMETNYSAGADLPWSFRFEKLDGTVITSFTLAYNSRFTNIVVVHISTNAEDYSYGEFRIAFRAGNGTSLATNYIGDNGTNYGGTIGDYTNDGPGYISMTNFVRLTVIPADIHYVSYYTQNPMYPYATPSTAATNIQDAVNAAKKDNSIVIIDSFSNYTSCTLMYSTNIVLKASNIYSPVIHSKNQDYGILVKYSYSNTIKNITVKSAGYSAVRIEGSRKVYLRDNTFYSNAGRAVSVVSAGGVNPYYIVMSNNNFIRNMNSRAIDSAGITNMFLLNNNFQYNSMSADYSIYFSTMATNIKIINNNFSISNNGLSLRIRGGIISNNTFFKSGGLTFFDAANNNKVVENTFTSNSGRAIYLSPATNTYIANNSINYLISGGYAAIEFTSKSYGNNITMNTVANYDIGGDGNGINDASKFSNIIQSNYLYGNRSGILSTAIKSYYKRNIIFKNNSWSHAGIDFDGATNVYLINNTIYSNGPNPVGGILFTGTPSENVYIRNNIIVWNKNEGINNSNGSIISNKYNCVYGNNNVVNNTNTSDGSGNYTGCSAGTGSFSKNPVFVSQILGVSNFLHLSNRSPCINAGDPNDVVPAGGGNIVDMGAFEFHILPSSLSLTKSISNIRLNGSDSPAIPGATIHYVIIYSNTGSNPAVDNVIYDNIANNRVIYKSNTAYSIDTTIIQFSTNTSPDFSYYNNDDWMDTEPSPEEVKWIRWKINSVPPNSGGKKIGYMVIIK